VSRMPKRNRRMVYLAATACVGVLAVVLLVTGFGGGSGNGVTYLDGNTNAVLYASGHRPQAPDFSGTTLSGTQLRFSAYRGKVVVLNFWGSWCPPCRSEASTLALVANQYQGVSFLGVDVRDTTVSAEAFMRSHGIKYPSVSDSDDTITLDFSSVVPIAATPTTLVIDRTGHIVGAVFGQVTYPELTTILTKATGASA
jgi:peroxiredoxin